MPRAISGSNAITWSAVMRLSRPNGATYQGMPAYGIGPSGVSVNSMWRSVRARWSHRLTDSESVWIFVACPARRSLPARRRCMISPMFRVGGGVSGSARAEMVSASSRWLPGGTATW